MIFPIILILGSLLLLLNDMGILKWYQMKKERNNIQIAINQLILEEKSLMEELDRLENDEEYLKNIAREQFHMVKPGEKVFRVIDRRKINNNK